MPPPLTKGARVDESISDLRWCTRSGTCREDQEQRRSIAAGPVPFMTPPELYCILRRCIGVTAGCSERNRPPRAPLRCYLAQKMNNDTKTHKTHAATELHLATPQHKGRLRNHTQSLQKSQQLVRNLQYIYIYDDQHAYPWILKV